MSLPSIGVPWRISRFVFPVFSQLLGWVPMTRPTPAYYTSVVDLSLP